MKLTGWTQYFFLRVLSLLGISPDDHKAGQRAGELEVEKNRINCLLFYVWWIEIVRIAVAWLWPPVCETCASRLPVQTPLLPCIWIHSATYLLSMLLASPAEVWVTISPIFVYLNHVKNSLLLTEDLFFTVKWGHTLIFFPLVQERLESSNVCFTDYIFPTSVNFAILSCLSS